MKSTTDTPNRPHFPAELPRPGVEPSTWQAAVEFTRNQAGSTPPSSDEWSCFWWNCWRPASRRWRTLLHDGGGVAFAMLRDEWDATRNHKRVSTNDNTLQKGTCYESKV